MAMTPGPGPTPNSGNGLPRRSILRGRTAFAEVFKRGDGTRYGDVVVKYLAIDTNGKERGSCPVAGFVVRRGVGGAVRRNRIRRLLREAWRLERRSFAGGLAPDVHLIVVLLWSGSSEGAMRLGLDSVRRDLVGALRKVERRLRSRPHEHNR